MTSKPSSPPEPGSSAAAPRQRRPKSSIPEHRPDRGAVAHPPPRKSELHRAPAHPRPAPTREEIARRAYELWQRNGCPQGRDVEHWCQAERELNCDSR
jgi:hypothetical protein